MRNNSDDIESSTHTGYQAKSHHERHSEPRRLLHSHAHEEDIPGTVNLQATAGDDTAYGQALFPVPSDDPNDPLQWPSWKKTAILILVSIYSFLGNSALTGPAVYIGIYAEQFKISPAIASGLISYPNLAYGFGSLILVPAYLKFGRRIVMLVSIALFFAGLVGSSRANSYGALMGWRVLHGLGSGVCEALPVQLVNDIFFLHERGTKIGYYTVCLCLGATGPLYAGYMLNAGLGWRLFFYVEAAFAGALFIASFLFVEESMYKRVLPTASTPPLEVDVDGKGQHYSQELELTQIPTRKSYAETLKPWTKTDKEANFFKTMFMPFTYFFVPAVFWVITSFGLYIGLGALAFNYTFPGLITAAPYNWSETNSGLIAVANIVGYLIAVPFTVSSDRVAAYLTKKNNGIREAEMRLPVLFPAMLIAPAGLIVFGLAAQYKLHWFAYFAGVAMVDFAGYFYFSFTLAYAVDSYQSNTSEMLIAMNLGKQAISFGLGSFLLDWILTDGYAVVIAGIFCAVVLANNLLLIPFWFYGKSIRRWTSTSWLGRLHGRTRGNGPAAL